MLIRLWWKELRTLAPIMATLVVAAAGLQWFLVSYGGIAIRNGVPIPAALCWGVLYALAAGSASFAGEREARTLGLLDALPVGRGTLWAGKASFALGSSLLLAALLRAIGSTGYAFEPSAFFNLSGVDPYFATLIAEAAVWGLFWSALTRTAITAGTLAVVSTGLSGSISGYLSQPDEPGRIFGGLDGMTLGWRLGLLGSALLVSWSVMTREHRSARRRPRPRPARVAATPPDGLATIWNRRFQPTPAFTRLAWQTYREGRGVWVQTMLLASLGSVSVGLLPDPLVYLVLLGLAVVIQAASVFGIESATGTRAFLDHQAVRPGTAWAGKLAPWVVGSPLLVWLVATLGEGSSRPASGGDRPAALAGVLFLAANLAGAALLGGMILRRRISAVMISSMAGLALLIPQAALFGAGKVSTASLAISPLILLGISWFWAGDWLAGRGWRRWSKLAALTLVPYGSLGVAYAAGRAWGVRDIGPQFGVLDRNGGPADLGARYAVELGQYQDSRSRVPELNPATPTADDGPGTSLAEFRRTSEQIALRLRLIAAEPGMVAAVTAPATIFDESASPPAVEPLTIFGALLTRVAQERGDRGDPAGAWQEILALLRMSRQFAAGARSVREYEAATQRSLTGVQLAADWARRPGVTLDLIRAARADLATVAEPVPLTQVLRWESWRVENSLDQPTERWADLLAPAAATDAPQPISRIVSSWADAPAWERERARRIMRQVAAIALRNAQGTSLVESFRLDGDPGLVLTRSQFQSGASLAGTTADLGPRAVLVTRLIGPFFQPKYMYDREVANQRLLATFLALRAWQLTHDGFAPTALDQLVPGELAELPADPFTAGGIFEYGVVEPTNMASVSADSANDPGVPGGMAGMMGGMVAPAPASPSPAEVRPGPRQYQLVRHGVELQFQPRDWAMVGSTNDLSFALPPDPAPRPDPRPPVSEGPPTTR